MAQTKVCSSMKSFLKCAFWLLLAGAAGNVLSGCSDKVVGADSQNKSGSRPTVPVIVAQAEERDAPIELLNIGNEEAFSTDTTRSQITAQILQMHFRVGL